MSDQEKFNEIIKGKLDQVEIPYDESHWEEMSQMLDKLPPAPSPSNAFLTNKYFLGAVAGAAIVGGVLLFTGDSEDARTSTEDQAVVEASNENTTIDAAQPVSNDNNVSEATSNDANAESTTNDQTVVTTDSSPIAEERIEHYANLSEASIEEQSKESVEDMLEAQSAELPADPKIDNPQLKTNILVDDKVLCAGSPIQFNIDRKIEGTTYAWNFGDKGLTSRKQSPTHIFKKAGNYTVTLIVSKSGEEKNNYKIEKEVSVGQNPILDVVSVGNQITLNDPYAEFEVESPMTCTYKWKFNDKFAATGEQAEFLIPERGMYHVEVIAASNNGCSSSKVLSYNAEKGVKIYVEDAFRPASNSANREFLPKELRETNVPFTFVVKSLAGDLVFESRDSYKAWNGSLNNNGSILPEGQYLWTLSFEDDKGVKHVQNGRIMLLH